MGFLSLAVTEGEITARAKPGAGTKFFCFIRKASFVPKTSKEK